jgi:HSP90 family molecular chaperone
MGENTLLSTSETIKIKMLKKELVLKQLGMFLGHHLISVEEEMRRYTKADD